MYTPKTLQNKSNWDKELPSIIIDSDSPEWSDAYNNWLNQKNPTDSKEWSKGVILTYENNHS